MKVSAHKASSFAKNTRKRLNDFHYRIKAVEQLAISVSKVFEFFGFVFENLKDIIGRMAGSKLINKGMLDRVDPDLLDIIGDGCFEDVLKRRRRHFRTVSSCRRDTRLFSAQRWKYKISPKILTAVLGLTIVIRCTCDALT